MTHQSHRISSVDFNKLTEEHKPNIVAYAMMLSGGMETRDSACLRAMSAIWDARKSYRPSEWPDFCQWCYVQVADAFAASDVSAEMADFAASVKDDAANFLPDTGLRMGAFDRAFLGLSSKDQKILSISCQHHKVRNNYIAKHYKQDVGAFERTVEKLKLSLVVAAMWRSDKPDRENTSESDYSAIIQLTANATGGEEAQSDLRTKLIQRPSLLASFFRHVSLQQALMTRLEDDPSSELRNGEFKKPRVLPALLIMGLLMIPVLMLTANQSGGANGMQDQAKQLYYSVVPEPSSISLLVIGLSSLILRRCREGI